MISSNLYTTSEANNESLGYIKRVGVVGGGQLAWMMASAARKLGIELVIQTPNASDPAVAIASETIFASVSDANATAALAEDCDCITFENEFVDLEALSSLEVQGICFRPAIKALSPLLDKYNQRCYLKHLGLPVPNFITLEEFRNQELGDNKKQEGKTQKIHPMSLTIPLVIKARRHGYDGQGTFIITDLETLQQQLAAAREQPGQFLLEEFVLFERELAVIAARSSSGEVVTYPVVETQQQDQVCRRVLVPADISLDVTKQVEAIAHTLLNSLQAVGVFGIELFLTSEGKILVNEIAPRTHNSGHYTIDACEVSQFEQQLRAVCGLPLGSSALRCACAVMVNLLGYERSQHDYLEKRQQIAQISQAKVHWYGKTISRPGRKLGHVTILLDTTNRQQALALAHQVESIWYPGEGY